MPLQTANWNRGEPLFQLSEDHKWHMSKIALVFSQSLSGGHWKWCFLWQQDLLFFSFNRRGFMTARVQNIICLRGRKVSRWIKFSWYVQRSCSVIISTEILFSLKNQYRNTELAKSWRSLNWEQACSLLRQRQWEIKSLRSSLSSTIFVDKWVSNNTKENSSGRWWLKQPVISKPSWQC